jgi:riboflavin synthase
VFTGLITRVGRLERRERTAGGALLRVTHEPWDTPVCVGESIAVQGVCLTVTACQAGRFTCDASGETLARSTLADTAVRAVNLERALGMADRLGGHFVAGHVDGVGTVERVTPNGRDHVLRVGVPAELTAELARKGSVAVDGVSLTISAQDGASVEAVVVPFSWTHSTLRMLRAGARVNIETDLLAKYVRRCLGTAAGARASVRAPGEAALRWTMLAGG